MTKFKQIIDEIIEQLQQIQYEKGDFTDIGNEIGMIVGKHIKPEDNKRENFGFAKVDFINGLNHGISLIDGTH